MKAYRIVALVGLAAALFFLAGCSGAKNQTPTTDPKAVYTQVAEQAAQTAQSQQTNVAKLTPRATNTTQPTDVPETPTVGTPNPTTSGTQPTTSGTQATAKPTTAGTAGTPQATTFVLPTSTKPAVASPDKMLYVSQTVADGSVFKPGDQFTQSWVVKNVGTTTWPNTYRVRFYGGERFGVQDFTLPSTVDPNKSVTLTVNMTAPSAVGQYNSIWVMTNNDGVNFGYFTFNLEVK